MGGAFADRISDGNNSVCIAEMEKEIAFKQCLRVLFFCSYKQNGHFFNGTLNIKKIHLKWTS